MPRLIKKRQSEQGKTRKAKNTVQNGAEDHHWIIKGLALIGTGSVDMQGHGGQCASLRLLLLCVSASTTIPIPSKEWTFIHNSLSKLLYKINLSATEICVFAPRYEEI